MIETMKNKAGQITGYRARIYGSDRKLTSSKVFRQKTLAQVAERRMAHERDNAIATGLTIKDSTPFSEFSQKWLDEKVNVRLGPSTQSYYASVLKNHLLPCFSALPLREMRIERANQLIRKLAAQGKEAKAINNIVGVLQSIMNDAVQWEYLAYNPLRALKPMKETQREFAYWSPSEIRQFLRANYRDPLYPLYVVALNTGARRGELCGLKWDRVDFVTNQISLTRNLNRYGLHESTKSGKKRVIPINPEVRQVLEPLWKRQLGPFVFCREDGSPVDVHHLPRRFVKAQAKAGFTSPIRWHDMRHTFASNFMMNGGNIYDLQKILGHSSLEMTQRYAHLSPLHLERAIRIVGFSGEEQVLNKQSNPDIIQNSEPIIISLVK